MLISVVVPLYKGSKYVDKMIRMVEENAKNVGILADLELIFVNDNPEETIDDRKNEQIRIKIINSKINRGIHAARVQGINQATGEYIIMLDQDDKISSNYVKSQMDAIGINDAVVCNMTVNGIVKREFLKRLPNEFSLEYMLTNNNPIVSPGQVMIRRNAINHYWLENIISVNGADDWFLWILMARDKKRFVINKEILFDYTENENNTSNNIVQMSKSEKEILFTLENKSILEEDKISLFKNLIEKRNVERIESLEKVIGIAFIYQKWISVVNNTKKNIDIWFKNNNVDSVYIYGAGEVGCLLKDYLMSESIVVSAFIDKRASELKDINGIMVNSIENIDDYSKLIILSVARKKDADVIKADLLNRGFNNIKSLIEILNEVEQLNRS